MANLTLEVETACSVRRDMPIFMPQTLTYPDAWSEGKATNRRFRALEHRCYQERFLSPEK
jgi:hypothetical protein